VQGVGFTTSFLPCGGGAGGCDKDGRESKEERSKGDFDHEEQVLEKGIHSFGNLSSASLIASLFTTLSPPSPKHSSAANRLPAGPRSSCHNNC